MFLMFKSQRGALSNIVKARRKLARRDLQRQKCRPHRGLQAPESVLPAKDSAASALLCNCKTARCFHLKRAFGMRGRRAQLIFVINSGSRARLPHCAAGSGDDGEVFGPIWRKSKALARQRRFHATRATRNEGTVE